MSHTYSNKCVVVRNLSAKLCFYSSFSFRLAIWKEENFNCSKMMSIHFGFDLNFQGNFHSNIWSYLDLLAATCWRFFSTLRRINDRYRLLEDANQTCRRNVDKNLLKRWPANPKIVNFSDEDRWSTTYKINWFKSFS